MAKFPALSSTWEIIREMDLRPLQKEALSGIRIALVGAPGSGRSTLAHQMRSDPAKLNIESGAPLLILDLDSAGHAIEADLIILVVDSRKTDTNKEQNLVKTWHNSGKRVLVFINQFVGELTEPKGTTTVSPWTSRGKKRVVWSSAIDTDSLIRNFVPAVIQMNPDRLLGLGRFFPLFRVQIAHHLINDTCLSNAAYAMSTGLAETVAVLDIPIAVTDMFILSKTQAFLVYKLGLALGYSTRWQDYVIEFGGILGGGFLWREIARTLVGFIPIWGILPKTAISYAGTYVIGHVILQWYLTGRHVSRQQMKAIYVQALERGRQIARTLLTRLHLPKLPRPRLPRRKKRALPQPETTLACPTCNRVNAFDASYCQYCGEPLEEEITIEDTQGSGAPEQKRLPGMLE